MIYEQVKSEVLTQLAGRGLDDRSGMGREAAMQHVVALVLAQRVARAYTVGVRPSYADWLCMHPDEQAAWEQAALDAARMGLAASGVAGGNTAMAKRALHDGDAEQQRWDAIEQGLAAPLTGE